MNGKITLVTTCIAIASIFIVQLLLSDLTLLQSILSGGFGGLFIGLAYLASNITEREQIKVKA